MTDSTHRMREIVDTPQSLHSGHWSGPTYSPNDTRRVVPSGYVDIDRQSADTSRSLLLLHNRPSVHHRQMVQSKSAPPPAPGLVLSAQPGGQHKTPLRPRRRQAAILLNRLAGGVDNPVIDAASGQASSAYELHRPEEFSPGP